MFNFKVTPKTFPDVNGSDFTIVTVRGRVVEMPLSLSADSIKICFYFAFFNEMGQEKGAKNATEKDVYLAFLKGIIAAQGGNINDIETAPDEVKALAQTKANTTIRHLIAGTKEERYAAASLFAGSFGYTLLPISEQIEN